MAGACAIDAVGNLAQDDPDVSSSILEEAYEGCRERLGGLGVSLPWFVREMERALGETPVEAYDKKLVVDDFYLALGCRCGNNGAWRLFDRTYRGYLLRLATRYAGNRGHAEDLITDLFHDLVTRPGREGKLEHYKGYAALSTWLAVIVRRMAMDRGRGAERRGARQPDAEAAQRGRLPAPSTHTGERTRRQASPRRRVGAVRPGVRFARGAARARAVVALS